MIPCKDCLLLGACRHKGYVDIFKECSLIDYYLDSCCSVHLRDPVTLLSIYKIMRPTNWSLKTRLQEKIGGKSVKIVVERRGSNFYHDGVPIPFDMTLDQAICRHGDDENER